VESEAASLFLGNNEFSANLTAVNPRSNYLLINPHRAELITRDEEKKYEYLYVMLRKKGRWLLESKKLRHIGAKWMKWSL
jgi:hypothetical protein